MPAPINSKQLMDIMQTDDVVLEQEETETLAVALSLVLPQKDKAKAIINVIKSRSDISKSAAIDLLTAFHNTLSSRYAGSPDEALEILSAHKRSDLRAQWPVNLHEQLRLCVLNKGYEDVFNHFLPQIDMTFNNNSLLFRSALDGPPNKLRTLAAKTPAQEIESMLMVRLRQPDYPLPDLLSVLSSLEDLVTPAVWQFIDVHRDQNFKNQAQALPHYQAYAQSVAMEKVVSDAQHKPISKKM